MESLNKFAIHEAYNSHKYGEVELYEWDPLHVSAQVLYWTSRPAKKVIFKMKAAYRATFVGDPYENTDYIVAEINGIGGDGKQIHIDVTNGLPFTIEGLLITQLNILMVSGYSDPADTSRDFIDIISYH